MKRRKYYFLLVTTFFIIYSYCSIFANDSLDSDEQWKGWVEIGPNVSPQFNDNILPLLSGFTGEIILNNNRNLFILRILNLNEIHLFIDPPEKFYEISLLFGKQIKFFEIISPGKKYLSVSGAIGISGIFGVLPGDKVISSNLLEVTYNEKKINTIGLPIDVQFNFAFTPYFGIGINYFLNLNKIKFYNGFSLFLIVGKL